MCITHFPFHQDLKGEMLHICKIQNVLFPFLFPIETDKLPGKLHQHFYRLQTGRKQKWKLLFFHGKIPGANLLQNSLRTFTNGLHLLF